MSREELELRSARKNATVHRRMRRISAFAPTESATDAAIRGAVAGARNRFTSIGEYARDKYDRYEMFRHLKKDTYSYRCDELRDSIEKSTHHRGEKDREYFFS